MKTEGQVANQQLRIQTARLALQQYGIRNARLRLVGDVHNLVFRVTLESECFALRLHLANWHSDAVIESEMMWLEAIRRETSLLVPKPVRNRRKDLLTRVTPIGSEEQHTCTLFHWLPGRIFWKRPSTDWLHTIGGLMADLQNHGAQFRPPAGFTRPCWDTFAITGREGILKVGWDGLPSREARILVEVRDRFEESAQDVGTEPCCFGLIHGDLHVANVVANAGTTAAIDFDDCCLGYYLSDIAATIDLLEFRPNYRELREAFLAGYGAIRPLPAEHLRLINYFLAARWLMICLFVSRSTAMAKDYVVFSRSSYRS